jgi:hypothetical protein
MGDYGPGLQALPPPIVILMYHEFGGCQSDQKGSAENKVFLINCLLGWAIPKVQIGALVNDDDDEEEEEEDAESF